MTRGDAPAPISVVMVTGAYHPEISSSGAQCREIARRLAGRAEVHVLTTSVDPSLPRHAAVDGVPVTRISVDVRRVVSRVRATRRMLVEMVRLASRCDVIHLHGYSSKNVLVTIVAKVFRRPIVMSLHTRGFDEPTVIDGRGRLARQAFRSADLYMSVSRGLVDSYLDAGLPADRIIEVPNGIDTERFSPVPDRDAARAGLGLAPRPVIAFVGFFSHDKQPRVLFDAWLQLQIARRIDATLLFVGATESSYFEVDSTIAAAMSADAAAAGVADRLRFAGVTRDVPAYLRAADIFVLPSRREGLPVALLEAMACGLPCVASRLPGSTDAVIEHGVNGLLTPPGDAAAIAGAIERLVHDPAERRRLGSAARATIIQRYSSDSVADRWLEAYERVVGQALTTRRSGVDRP